MSILDLDDNVNNVPEFKIGDIVKQYLDDINGIVDPDLPFEYVPGVNIYGKVNDCIKDEDILVRDNSWPRYYNVDGYYFCSPHLITSSFTMHTVVSHTVTEIKECIAPGIYKRATWGWIKKHFNIV
jgi:hypothetical protein